MIEHGAFQRVIFQRQQTCSEMLEGSAGGFRVPRFAQEAHQFQEQGLLAVGVRLAAQVAFGVPQRV